MAEEDGYALMEETDYDWLYVEDDYPLSDELAEMQIPDPGYAGTNLEIYQDHADIDWIDYWDELEYVDDEYWDNAQLGALASKLSAKRKRDENITESAEVKRRRLAMEGIENIKFVTIAKRLERYKRLPPSLGEVKPIALLPDWRDRFADATGVIAEKPMPEAMKKAAEAQDEDTPPKQRQFDALVEEGDDEEWMDEDEVEDEDEAGGDIAAQVASIPPEMLEAILRQKLGDKVFNDMDENTKEALLSTFAKVLSGDEGAGEAADDLTNVILGQAEQGDNSASLEFLSQLGISLPKPEDDEDGSSVVDTELPENSTTASRSNVEVSPPDSAIEMLQQRAETRQMAIHGSSPSVSGKKRAAPLDSEEEGSTKRKKVSFDVPASSQPTDAGIVEDGEAETYNTDVSHQIEKEAEPATSDDPLMSETTVGSTKPESETKAANLTSANEKAAKANGSISTRATGAKNYAKPTAAASAKQTRKRKAEADEDDVEAGAPKQKRPARKAAKSEPEVTEAQPPARRTRSARAKAGK